MITQASARLGLAWRHSACAAADRRDCLFCYVGCGSHSDTFTAQRSRGCACDAFVAMASTALLEHPRAAVCRCQRAAPPSQCMHDVLHAACVEHMQTLACGSCAWPPHRGAGQPLRPHCITTQRLKVATVEPSSLAEDCWFGTRGMQAPLIPIIPGVFACLVLPLCTERGRLCRSDANRPCCRLSGYLQLCAQPLRRGLKHHPECGSTLRPGQTAVRARCDFMPPNALQYITF